MEGKDNMQQPQFLYKVWIPGQTPTAHNSALALYSQQSVKFFVEAIAHQAQLFIGQSFAMCAYQVQSQGEELEIAQGVYQFRPDQDGHIRLWTLYEKGVLADYGGTGIISNALIEACMQIEQEQEERHVQIPH